jgi:excisionase family DNA binding protein
MDTVTKPVPSTVDTLWDALDVAQYCKISRSWVYQQAESGRLPHLRVGGLLRFDPERVKAFARGETTVVRALRRA